MTFESVVGIAILLCVVAVGFLAGKKTRIIGKVLLTLLSLVCIGVLTFMFWLGFAFSGEDFYAWMVLVSGILLLLVIWCSLWGAIRKKTVWIPICSCLAVCILSTGGYAVYQAYVDRIPVIAEGGNALLYDYEPYGENTKVAVLEEEAALQLTEDLPRMDGATALYPVYSAFARAVYPRDMLQGAYYKNDYVMCNTTTGAYDSIVLGDADIIFAAMPSEAQLEFAKAQGVTLEFTPIGREAFVFFVNAQNPLENITVEEIRKIYSGELTSWKDLGINGLGSIRAFQRDEGSGSQSALVRLMGEKKLMTPPKEDVVGGMGGIIERTADYKNYKNAIGYSFRFYSTQMVKNDQIRLLRVNGILPATENIKNGTYPLASHFYAVTRSDASENTKKLLGWILSTQGQMLIERSGYTANK